MEMIKRWLACIAFSIVWTAILALALNFIGLPTRPINWPVSLSLFSLLTPAYFFCLHHPKRVKALVVCSIVSAVGLFCFYISDNVAFNQLIYSIAWVGASGLIWLWLRQALVAIMCSMLAVFGAVMVLQIGVEIPPGQYELWVIGRNLLWVGLITAPIAETWIEEDAPTEIKTSCEQSAGGHKQAA